MFRTEKISLKPLRFRSWGEACLVWFGFVRFLIVDNTTLLFCLPSYTSLKVSTIGVEVYHNYVVLYLNSA